MAKMIIYLKGKEEYILHDFTEMIIEAGFLITIQKPEPKHEIGDLIPLEIINKWEIIEDEKEKSK